MSRRICCALVYSLYAERNICEAGEHKKLHAASVFAGKARADSMRKQWVEKFFTDFALGYVHNACVRQMSAGKTDVKNESN